MSLQNDPVACLDAVFLFIGEFLSDWTTMLMLAVLLGLLLKLRADQKKARAAEYAAQMIKLDDRRQQDRHQNSIRGVEDAGWVNRS